MAVARCRAAGTECSLACVGPLKETTTVFITYSIVWLQVSNREATQPQPSTENCIKDLLNMAPPTRRLSFPLSQSLPSGSFHKPLILLHQKADIIKTTNTEN